MGRARPHLGAGRPPALLPLPGPRQAGADLRPRGEEVGRGDGRGEVEVGGGRGVEGAQGEGEGVPLSQLVGVRMRRDEGTQSVWKREYYSTNHLLILFSD